MIVNNVYKSVNNQQRNLTTAVVRYLIFELSVRHRQLFENIKTKKPGILTQLAAADCLV
jgi:hypothetical protein